MHQKNRNVPDSVNSYDIKLELQEITGDATFCTLGIGKILIFTIFMVMRARLYVNTRLELVEVGF